MTLKNTPYQFIPFLFAAVFLGSNLSAQTVSADKIRMLASPSNEHLNVISQTMFTAMCYGFTSGREVECSNEYLYTGLGAEGFNENCIYSAEGDLDRESCVNGGHTHADDRPQTFDDTRPIAFDGDDQDPSVFGIYGVQNVVDGQPAVEPIITVDVSQAAGFYSWNGVLRIETPGWMFHDGPGVQDENTAYVYEGVTEVGIRGLKQLPDSLDYIKVRSADVSHVDAVAFAGAPEMLEAISVLAK